MQKKGMGKTKSQKVFTEHYILLQLESDYKIPMQKMEQKMLAQDSPLETSYYLIAQKHLIETDLAQAVIDDIFNAYMKIRS